jgi:hypothetical protein
MTTQKKDAGKKPAGKTRGSQSCPAVQVDDDIARRDE